jgi:hypothetical protein
MHFSAPFEIKHRGNVRAHMRSWPLAQDWFGLQGDLVNEETGEVISFYQEVSWYSGSDSDGSWTEGSTEDTEYLSSVPPGRYVLRTIPVYANPANPTTTRNYSVRLTSDVPRALWFVLALMVLLAWPVILTVRASGFETRRWNDSNLTPSASSSDD